VPKGVVVPAAGYETFAYRHSATRGGDPPGDLPVLAPASGRPVALAGRRLRPAGLWGHGLSQHCFPALDRPAMRTFGRDSIFSIFY
jgi:hypothetical protein